MRFGWVMFIYTYTDVEGSESQRVAGEIDHVMKPAFGDRPGVSGRQGTGPRLSARMLQEYEAAHRALVNGIVTDDMVQLVDNGNYGVGMNVKSPCGLTLCHAVQGNAVTTSLNIEDMHYHQQWTGAPMEVIDRSRLVEASQVFLEHAAQWREQIAAAFKADSKGVKMRNMAMNNMDAYLARYFDGTGITYYFDKRHVDGHKSHLWVRLNAYKTLDLPIPHDDFINHLDLVKPHMVEFAYMARDGRFTVRGEVRDDWQTAPAPSNEPTVEQPRPHGVKGWLKRMLDGSNSGDKTVQTVKSPLQRSIDEYFQGKRIQYHLTEDEETGQCLLHIRLNHGRAMVIDLKQADNLEKRLQHDLGYIPRLIELGDMFPYRLVGPLKKAEWITAKSEQ